MYQGDYYLGLDVGTNSVGWAVTDESYNLLKLKGKSAWGVRLFDEANTAEKRRKDRSNRRRKKRHAFVEDRFIPRRFHVSFSQKGKP